MKESQMKAIQARIAATALSRGWSEKYAQRWTTCRIYLGARGGLTAVADLKELGVTAKVKIGPRGGVGSRPFRFEDYHGDVEVTEPQGLRDAQETREAETGQIRS
jgi:hypothetical protein